MNWNDSHIADMDPQLFNAISAELKRQQDHVELIASENYTSAAVMAMQGSILTNKYAEGYPAKRYYGGCEHVDVVEQLAIERARELFSCEYVNVQPHSGSQANAAVFQALVKPGDTYLGMDLSAGGHLTHGCPVNFSGKNYNAITYGLDESGDINYAAVEALALEHNPKMIIAGFSAFSGVVDWQRFREIADKVGAYLFVDMAHVAGLVAGGVYPSPLPFADVVTTTTHKTLRGPRGGLILANSCAKNPDLFKQLNSAIFPGTQGGPLMHVIAAKAVAFDEALQLNFRDYCAQVLSNAQAMADQIAKRGYSIVSGGTHNHMFLVDLSGRDLTGKVAEEQLGLANITLNKNSVPGDMRSPFVTSGVRIGTPAITTRGFGEGECELVADAVCDIFDAAEDEAVITDVRTRMQDLCAKFPIYKD
jgi:glycine hydroxymethyltransferase